MRPARGRRVESVAEGGQEVGRGVLRGVVWTSLRQATQDVAVGFCVGTLAAEIQVTYAIPRSRRIVGQMEINQVAVEAVVLGSVSRMFDIRKSAFL